MTHLRYIDSLRGIAFLGVLSVHVALQAGNFPGRTIALLGHLGVPLFFLLSSVTLMRSMSIRSSQESRPIFNFYLRRFFRIAPLYWFGILLYFVYFGFQPRYFAPNGVDLADIFLNVTFLHGLSPQALSSVVPGGWSIAAEMMFYLLLPALAVHIDTTRRAAIAALASFVLCGAITFPVRKVLLDFYPEVDEQIVSTFANHWFPAYLPIFLLGILLYFVISRRHLNRFHPAVLTAVAVVVSTAAFNISVHYLSTFLFSCALAVGVVVVAIKPFRLIVNPLTAEIGKISFSAYILHFAAIKAVKVGITSVPFLSEAITGKFLEFPAIWLGTLGVTWAASTISYRFIELSGIRLGKRAISYFEAKQSTCRRTAP